MFPLIIPMFFTSSSPRTCPSCGKPEKIVCSCAHCGKVYEDTGGIEHPLRLLLLIVLGVVIGLWTAATIFEWLFGTPAYLAHQPTLADVIVSQWEWVLDLFRRHRIW